MSKLEFILLGRFECLHSSGNRISLSMRKAEVLLAYLALTPGLRHPRERLINLLWSERSDEQARKSRGLERLQTDLNLLVGIVRGICTGTEERRQYPTTRAAVFFDHGLRQATGVAAIEFGPVLRATRLARPGALSRISNGIFSLARILPI